MKNIFRLTCLIISLCFITLPAQALDFKPYTGVGLGSFIIDAGPGSEYAFGGYGILGVDFHENFGIELRVGQTGTTAKSVIVPTTGFTGLLSDAGPVPITLLVPTPASIRVDWFLSYLFKVQQPIGSAFNVYGLLGATTLHSSLSFPSLGRTGHITTTTISYGGGVDFNLSNQWIVGMDAMVYSNRADTNPGANFRGLDVWGLTGTIKYMF